MANSFTCPKCDKLLKLSQSVAAGTKVKCPQCATIFAAPGDGDEDADVAPPRQRSRRDEEFYEDEDDRPRPRRKKKKAGGGMPGWALGLIIGGPILLVLLIVGGIVLFLILSGNAARQQLIGRWEVTNHPGLGTQVYEFTSDGRIKINTSVRQQGINVGGLDMSGTYRWVDNQTIEITLLGIPLPHTVNRSGDTLTLTPQAPGSRATTLRRLR